jgi:hypothetical protein
MNARPTAARPTPPPAPSTALAVTGSTLPTWAAETVGAFTGRQDVNLILPAIPIGSDLAWGYKAKASIVQISTDENHQEIYKVGWKDGENRYALGKSALEKIANAAGIQFRTRRVDDRSNPDYCEFECVAGMKNESGQPIVQARTKAFDMADVRAESLAQRLKANERANDKKTAPDIEAEVEREMKQFKKHIVARTETGAINRAIRGLLGLRSQWTKAEIAKPFVLMRVDWQPDASDPETRRILLDQGAQASRALYRDQPMDVLPTRDRAQVIEEPEGEENGDGEDPTTAPPQTEPAQAGEMDYLSLVSEGCRVLGIESAERNALFLKHHGDLKAIYGELNARASAA